MLTIKAPQPAVALAVSDKIRHIHFVNGVSSCVLLVGFCVRVSVMGSISYLYKKFVVVLVNHFCGAGCRIATEQENLLLLDRNKCALRTSLSLTGTNLYGLVDRGTCV